MREVRIQLPRLHAGQQKVVDEAARFNVLECGRRFGKTALGKHVIIKAALAGHPVGWFAPNYKILLPVQDDVFRILSPLGETNKVERRVRLINGGSVEFWSLDDADAGRSRKYKRVGIDEASIVPNLQTAWEQAIRPTLTDLRGDAYFFGTPKGRNYFHKLFARGESGEPEWKSWRLPTTVNPHIPPEEIQAAERELPPAVFAQEYLGIPADDGGNPFDLSAIRRCIAPLSTDAPAFFGVDLAKSHDWTWVIGLDADRRVCVNERWQSDWGQTRRRLVSMIGAVPALIDSTGVGDPIVEDLCRELENVEGFKFTQMSKQQIMEGLASAIQRHEIAFPTGVLQSELESFEYEYTRTGVRYSAPEGQHDDGVCALALANHKASRPFLTLEMPTGDIYAY